MHKINWKTLLINIAIPLLVGGLSALFTMNSMDVYSQIEQPPLSPPSWLFPVVWTILFILMGISSYLIWENKTKDSKPALFVYATQLVVNFFWSIVFFNLRQYGFAIVVILVLLALILLTIYLFKDINKAAAWLLVPYLLWVLFATYLNIAIAILN